MSSIIVRISDAHVAEKILQQAGQPKKRSAELEEDARRHSGPPTNEAGKRKASEEGDRDTKFGDRCGMRNVTVPETRGWAQSQARIKPKILRCKAKTA